LTRTAPQVRRGPTATFPAKKMKIA